MTQQAELFRSIEKLPPQYFGQVIDFVGYLQQKAAMAHNDINDQKDQPKGRMFGCSKGKYNITEAFFEPLEDFKDYM